MTPAHLITAKRAMELREAGSTFRQIALELKLGSRERAKTIVARAQRLRREAMEAAKFWSA